MLGIKEKCLTFIEECPKIVRAINYPNGVPGKGYYKLELIKWKKNYYSPSYVKIVYGNVC